MRFDQLLEEVRRLIGPILQSRHAELVDLEYQRESHGWVLRVYIDHEGGVNLEDCSEVSGELGAVLEVQDLIPNPYTLEVSSPGLTRPLRKLEDYDKYRNRLVKIRTHEPIEGQRNFKGILQGLEGEKVYLQMEGKILGIPFQGIAKANLEIEF